RIDVTDFSVFKPVDSVRAVGKSEKAVEGLPKLLERGRQIIQSGAPSQRLCGGNDVAACHQKRIVEWRRLVEIEHPRNATRLRRLADRRYEIRVAVVEEHSVCVSHRAFGMVRRNRTQSLIASRRDCFFSTDVDQDQGYR